MLFPSFRVNICAHMNWDVHSVLVVSSRADSFGLIFSGFNISAFETSAAT